MGHSGSGFGLRRPTQTATGDPVPTGPAVDGKRIKNGHMFVRDLQAPSEVGPGESITVNVTVSNGAASIFGSDPDSCQQSGFFAGMGYLVNLDVNTGWTSETREYCHGTTEFGTADRDFTFSFIAPEPSSTTTYNLLVTLELPGSGQSLIIRRTITVLPPTPGGCTSDADCPSGMVCENGQCVERDDGDDGNGGDDGDGGTTPPPSDGEETVVAGLTPTELAGIGIVGGLSLVAINRSRSQKN